jgi:hypothetical protein
MRWFYVHVGRRNMSLMTLQRSLRYYPTIVRNPIVLISFATFYIYRKWNGDILEGSRIHSLITFMHSCWTNLEQYVRRNRVQKLILVYKRRGKHEAFGQPDLQKGKTLSPQYKLISCISCRNCIFVMWSDIHSVFCLTVYFCHQYQSMLTWNERTVSFSLTG